MPHRNELQDIGHASIIAMLAEAVVVAFFIAAMGVLAAIGSGA